MAKLKATPKNFAEALQVFDNFKRGSRIGSVRLGNNTYLESYVDGSKVDLICIRLHNTNIVKFYFDGRITLHTKGPRGRLYRTVTTKERINKFVPGRVWQKDYQWFYNPPILRDEFGNVRCETVATVIFDEGLDISKFQ